MILLSSCRKDELVFVPDQEYIINQKLLLKDLGYRPIAAIVNISDSKNVYELSEGWMLNVPSGSILDQNGKVFTGQLKVQYLSINNHDLNILQAPSTWSGQFPYVVNKMFYYKLSLEELGLSLTQPVFLFMADTLSDLSQDKVLGFQELSSKWEEYNELRKFSYQNWSIPDNEGSKLTSGYKIPITYSEQWMISIDPKSSDYYYEKSLEVQLPQKFNSSNTTVFIVSLENKALLRLSGYNHSSVFRADNYNFYASHPYKIITLSQMGENNYYFGMTNVVESKNIYNIENINVSKNELIKLLSEL